MARSVTLGELTSDKHRAILLTAHCAMHCTEEFAHKKLRDEKFKRQAV